MIRLEFSPEIIEELLYEKRHHPHPRVRRKMEALHYKSQGMPHHQICQLSHIRGRAPWVRYFREYQEGGLDQLRKLNCHKQESLLAFHRDQIEETIAERPPATINEARCRIEALTGTKWSHTAMHRFLKRTLG
jgi:transposase